jgi:type III secretion system-like peptide-binding chaperone
MTMPVAGATNAEIRAALRRLVADGIEAGTFVILEGDATRNYYVQFAIDSGLLFCEAATNQYLEPEDQLDEGQMRALESLGWGPPEHEAQNWFRTFQPVTDADYEEIIRLARRAFADVYRLPPDGPLDLTCSWEDADVAADSGIRFASEGHRETYGRILRFAREIFEDHVLADPDTPGMLVARGSIALRIVVNPIAIHSTIVEITGPPLRGVAHSPGLLEFLLKANARVPFGAFVMAGDGRLALRGTLIGDTVDLEELMKATEILFFLVEDLYAQVASTSLSTETDGA